MTDEATREVPPAERIEEGDRLGARITLGDRVVTILFNTTGPLAAQLNFGDKLHNL